MCVSALYTKYRVLFYIYGAPQIWRTRITSSGPAAPRTCAIGTMPALWDTSRVSWIGLDDLRSKTAEPPQKKPFTLFRKDLICPEMMQFKNNSVDYWFQIWRSWCKFKQILRNLYILAKDFEDSVTAGFGSSFQLVYSVLYVTVCLQIGEPPKIQQFCPRKLRIGSRESRIFRHLTTRLSNQSGPKRLESRAQLVVWLGCSCMRWTWNPTARLTSK